MSLHDEYARVTPFEIAFPDDQAMERLLREVEQEASSRGVDAQLPGVFVTLAAVGDFVRELQAPDAPDEAVQELAALLFHAVHFAREGRRVHLLETSATRYLVGGAPSGEPRPLETAGYLQLPQHLFWMGGAGGGAAESIDGLFWFASDEGLLHVLPVTGVHAEGMSFRAIPLPDAPLADAPRWLDADVREGSPDYSTSLPGHELDRLYSVETAGEVLKLLARVFAYVDSVPAAVERGDDRAEARSPKDPTRGPRPSTLPFNRIKLVA